MNEPLSRPDPRPEHNSCPYESGETIPQSGIYGVCHSDGTENSAVLLAGEAFPACSCCLRGGARYRLIRRVPYLFEDEDFQSS
jgi:hypothetical protein